MVAFYWWWRSNTFLYYQSSQLVYFTMIFCFYQRSLCILSIETRKKKRHDKTVLVTSIKPRRTGFSLLQLEKKVKRLTWTKKIEGKNTIENIEHGSSAVMINDTMIHFIWLNEIVLHVVCLDFTIFLSLSFIRAWLDQSSSLIIITTNWNVSIYNHLHASSFSYISIAISKL